MRNEHVMLRVFRGFFLFSFLLILFAGCALDGYLLEDLQKKAKDAEAAVTGVTLNKTALVLPAGGEETLAAEVQPEIAKNKKVSWVSDNPAIAAVNEAGKVTAITPGTAVITVTTDHNKKTASCTVTVTASGPAITVTAHPAAANFTVGEISGSLFVAAGVTEGAALSYQWYSNTEAVNTGGTIISGATNAHFAIPADLAVGTYYYFCEISATGGALNGAASVRSHAAAVTVTAVGVPVITINTQPAAMTHVTAGNISGSLSVTAHVTEGAVLSYQWYSNTSDVNTGGTVISGATGASFSIPVTLTAGTYYYFCEINATGEAALEGAALDRAASIRSDAATVTVTAPGVPVITIEHHPATANFTVGEISGSLFVIAGVTEGAALSYQWYSNTGAVNTGGTVISGATNAHFTIPAGLAVGTYYYFCEINATGGALSGAAPVRSHAAAVTVTAVGVPVITINTQPVEVTNVTAGSISGSLSVTAHVTEGAVLSYQWYSNTADVNTGGTVISGATGASYAIPVTLTAGTYYYFCEVSATNGAIPVRSDIAAVTVTAPGVPIITINTHPVSTTNFTIGAVSGSLHVAASVTEGAALSFQWFSNTSAANAGGTEIYGATDAGFTIPATLTVGTYYYFCEVRAVGAASVRSDIAAVTITAPGIPVITINTQPAATTNVTVGGIHASLSVGASVTEGAAISYQWYINTTPINAGGTLIANATGASYILPEALSVGTYYFFCEVSATGGAAAARSNMATVNVVVPIITINAHPATVTTVTVADISGSLAVAVSATGNAAPGYQWYSNSSAVNVGGAAIAGATGSSFAIPTTLAAGTYYYFCEISTANGATPIRSNAATVNVVIPVITINNHPAVTTNVIAGSISGSLSVSVSVTGNAALSYQWHSNTGAVNTGGTVIAGADGSSFAIPSTLAAGTYYYFCEVIAANGAIPVRSNAATVIAASPETFTITFNQIADAAPDIEEPVIHRSSVNGPTTATITVADPEQYGSIEWSILKAHISGSGGSFTVDSANAAYNNTGKHFLTVEVIKNGIPYSRTVTFTVAD